MNRLIILLSALAAGLFSSCAVSPLPPAEKQTAMNLVEGEWFLLSSNTLLGFAIPAMNANRMSIQPDGKMILSLDDSAIQNRLAVMKTTDTEVEMRLAQALGGNRTMIYDRATNTLTIPVKMKSQDKLTGGWNVSYLPYSFGRAGTAR